MRRRVEVGAGCLGYVLRLRCWQQWRQFPRKIAMFCVLITCFCVQGARCATSGTELPTSARAERAMAKVSPELKKALNEMAADLGGEVFIRVFKREGELEVWVKNREQSYALFRTYPICNYSGGLGPKERQGDHQAPEGFYYVNAGRLNPWSRFHLSMNLGYPNAYDRARGRTGSALMIHGNCVSIGCYAMTDAKIEEIYTLVYQALAHGQALVRVHVFPFKMTASAMAAEKDNLWYGFWRNLQEGYRYFETHGEPPNVEVANRRYIFNAIKP